MIATRTRRLAPVLIATLLAGGAASLSSTAFAAPTATTASVTTDADTESTRTVKTITKTPRTVKTIRKTESYPAEGILGGGGGSAGSDAPRSHQGGGVMWADESDTVQIIPW